MIAVFTIESSRGEGEGWSVAMSTASNERGLNLRAPGRFTAAKKTCRPP